MEKVVELETVSKKYEQIYAVKNVSFQVYGGEFLTLLGPSGCGKTTILRLIAGFEAPTQGKIYINNRDVTALPPYRRNVNTVFQHYALFPHLNVYDNVAFGLERRGETKTNIARRVGEALELVKLEGFQKRYPSQLSGGEKQRVALARALVLKPEVLLLDEPLAALDVKLRKAMQLELKNLQKQLGITFIFVTHDQEEALILSDRIAVMNQGRLEQVDTPSRIYDCPATAFVADFMGVQNLFRRSRIETIDNGTFVVRTAGGLTIFSSRRDNNLNRDDEVTVAVRPERISLNERKPRGSHRNLFRGTIVEKFYIGATTNLVVSLLGNEHVSVIEKRGDLDRIDVGSKVYVWWDEIDTLVLD